MDGDAITLCRERSARYAAKAARFEGKAAALRVKAEYYQTLATRVTEMEADVARIEQDACDMEHVSDPDVRNALGERAWQQKARIAALRADLRGVHSIMKTKKDI
jgi:predicted  nucleic acid-binding Zn-ribbon protein